MDSPTRASEAHLRTFLMLTMAGAAALRVSHGRGLGNPSKGGNLDHMAQGAENGRKRAILWDNDGVLVDTEKWHFEANRLELAALGVTATCVQFEEVNLKRGVSHFCCPGWRARTCGIFMLGATRATANCFRLEDRVRLEDINQWCCASDLIAVP